MKTYAQQQTEIFKKYKGFFAFSTEQLERGMTEHGIKHKDTLVFLDAGLIVPRDNAKALMKDLQACHVAHVEWVKVTKHPQQIIIEQLYNHECQITGDDTDARERLADYGFTDEQFQEAWKVFWAECIENDSF